MASSFPLCPLCIPSGVFGDSLYLPHFCIYFVQTLSSPIQSHVSAPPACCNQQEAVKSQIWPFPPHHCIPFQISGRFRITPKIQSKIKKYNLVDPLTTTPILTPSTWTCFPGNPTPASPTRPPALGKGPLPQDTFQAMTLGSL